MRKFHSEEEKVHLNRIYLRLAEHYTDLYLKITLFTHKTRKDTAKVRINFATHQRTSKKPREDSGNQFYTKCGKASAYFGKKHPQKNW